MRSINRIPTPGAAAFTVMDQISSQHLFIICMSHKWEVLIESSEHVCKSHGPHQPPTPYGCLPSDSASSYIPVEPSKMEEAFRRYYWLLGNVAVSEGDHLYCFAWRVR